MSVLSLDIEKNSNLESFIAVCKSDSHINGLQLRKAHYELGKILASEIANNLSDNSITIIIMMRAGLCFGMGIADKLEQLNMKTSILFYYSEEQWDKEKNNYAQMLENDIILVDAVVNTGDSIIKFAQTIENNRNIYFATNIISRIAVDKFEDKSLYAIRISEKNFKGSKISIVKDGKGPDTGDRLFTQYELFCEQ
jgi:hypoxanthine-guanine phosphoribosyltransferase